jgi:peptide/nickel transport system substrate-binding protein
MANGSGYWERWSSRRRLLVSAAAMGAAAAGLGLAGCGSDNKPASSTGGSPVAASTAAAPSAAAAGKRGGILNDRLTSDPPGFDLHQFITFGTTWSQAPVYDGLVRYKPSQPDYPASAIEGVLATSWEQPDPTTLVFKLKPGVKFHNGSAFTADDVKANYEWIKTPSQGKSTYLGAPFLAVSAIEAPDDATVRIKFSRPNPSFLLVTAAYPYAIHEGKLLRSQGGIQQPGIGTGPFKFKAYQQSNTLELERNPSYHVEGLPYLDGIKFFVQPDQESAKASFLGGQTHLYHTTSRGPDDLDSVKAQLGDKVVTSVSQPAANRAILAFGPGDSPLKDVRVRKALHMALLRDDANQFFVQGKSKPGGYMRPGGPWALPASELAKYAGYGPLDVAAAKQLLSSAGAADLAFRFLTAPTTQTLAEFVQNQLRKIGVAVTLEPVDLNTHRARLASGDFQLTATQIASVIDDPDQTFADAALEKGAFNYGRISSAQVQDLFDKQTVILDTNARRAAVQDLERAAMELYTGASIYVLVLSRAERREVKNFFDGYGDLVTNRQFREVWLDA